MIQTRAKAKSRNVIKGYFAMKAGQLPTKDQFGSFIDSALNIKDDMKLEQSDIEGLTEALGKKLDANQLPDSGKMFESLKSDIESLINTKVTEAVKTINESAAATAVQVADFTEDKLPVGSIRQYVGDADEENGYYTGFFYKKIREHSETKPEPEMVTEVTSVTISKFAAPTQSYLPQDQRLVVKYNQNISYTLTPTDSEITIYRDSDNQGNPDNLFVIDGDIKVGGVVWEMDYARKIKTVTESDTAFLINPEGVAFNMQFPYANEQTLPVYYNEETGDYISMFVANGDPTAHVIIILNDELEVIGVCRAWGYEENSETHAAPVPADWKMVAVSPLFID
ncbi:MAG: hypothetical protein IKP73_00095 [Bacteroidales bacterium]|nr:hypothetical protein [Bacteroidales bacterium]